MQAAERGRRGFPAWDAGADEMDGFASSSSSSSSPMGGGSYIEHRVSRMDTLAGVAIKYGVEVADIKRMNGLVTDLQMFALRSLHIPCPGRHPPSPVLSDGPAVDRVSTPSRRPLDDVLDSFQLNFPQRKVSSAMNSLQGYYGLMPLKKVPEGTEMAAYRSGRAQYLEDQPLHRDLPLSDLSRHRKSRSLINVNGLLPENGEIADVLDSGEADRSIRRRQKADAGPSMRTPELLLKEDSSGGFSGRTAKSLALRPKSGSRADADMARLYAMSNSRDPFLADGLAAVRKSSSTSNLQESDNGYGSSIRPMSKWSLKPDAIARPIFDGLPKPITIRKNKAALD